MADSEKKKKNRKYVPPKDVISPKQYLTLTAVLDDPGPGKCALALITWEGKAGFAMRWNGDNKGKNGIGNPQSRGVPTWFVLGDNYDDAIMSTLSSEDLKFVKRCFSGKEDED